LGEDDRVFVISAATREGCEDLIKAIAETIDQQRRDEAQFINDVRLNEEAEEVKITTEA
jgi:GTP-binding protein